MNVGRMVSHPSVLPLFLGLSWLVLSALPGGAQTCQEAPAGLIAWWRFDETGGRVALDSAGDHAAAYFDFPAPTPGKVGPALRFDGSNDFVAAADSERWAFGARDFTIELWARFDQPGSGSIGHPSHIFLGNDEGPNLVRKWFFALGGGYLNFHVNSPTLGGQFFPLVPFAPEVNRWYHLAITRASPLYTIYIDGVAAGSASRSFDIPDPSSSLSIGQAESLGFFNGALDEVSIYDRALSAEEIGKLAGAGSAGKCKDAPVGELPTLLGPSPYLGESDSPFFGLGLDYFYLEDFEDQQLNTPGVTASIGAGGPPGSFTDSVDLDDGMLDGHGNAGGAFWAFASSITFTFDDVALGHLPTHAGVVWTDAESPRRTSVFIEAFDASGASSGLFGPFAAGDQSTSGTTAEDRFLGVIDTRGISALRVFHQASQIEVDHLQYGWLSGCEKEICVNGLSPRAGGDTGSTTVRIQGSGLTGGMNVRLVRPGHAPIEGQYPLVSAAGDELAVVLDLAGAARGSWRVNLIDSRGSERDTDLDFVVEEGRGSEPWVQIAAPSAVRAGQLEPFHIVYGNRGNSDVEWMVIWIDGLPVGARCELAADLVPPEVEGLSDVNWDDLPIAITSEGLRRIPLFLIRVPPGNVGILPIRISVPSPGPYQLEAWESPAFSTVPSVSIANVGDGQAAFDCLVSIFTAGLDVLGLTPGLPGSACVEALAAKVLHQLAALYHITRHPSLMSVSSLFAAMFAGYAHVALECGIAEAPGIGEAVALSHLLLHTGPQAFTDCREFYRRQTSSHVSFNGVTSIDPNEKVGAHGVTPAAFVAQLSPLPYSVMFENLPAASAPAQRVLIVDSLDDQRVDPASVTLGPIAFGDRVILPPTGVQAFAETVDLRPEQDLLVRIEARLDAPTGVLTWRLNSIDPATGLPPTDPLSGFLPPNVNPPEGSGSVLFTVAPQPGLATGTEIRNSARIVFDQNGPIDTPEWLNTIDATPPASAVAVIAPSQWNAAFRVQWVGSDEGAGVKDYTVLVSTDRGPSVPWLVDTPLTSATFTGEYGHGYAFYSIARDHTGLPEEAPGAPDTSTFVAVDGDGDGIPGPDDNCPAVPNQGQEDLDGDAIGDVCDAENTIAIDIIPEASPNVVDPSSPAPFPVAVLTTERFDALTLLSVSLELGPEGANPLTKESLRTDIDRDGDLDLVLYFLPPGVGLTCESTTISLVGKLVDGPTVKGDDTVQVARCP